MHHDIVMSQDLAQKESVIEAEIDKFSTKNSNKTNNEEKKISNFLTRNFFFKKKDC